MKRIFAAILLLAILPCLMGCQPLPETTGSTAAAGTTGSSTTRPTQTTPPPPPPDPYYQVDYEKGTVMTGSLEAMLAAGEPLDISWGDPYKGTPGYDYASPSVYSFVESISTDRNLTWSPQNWQTAADGHIVEYTTSGLYSFVLNSDLTGWTILCEMAAAAPENVTQAYVGAFGVTEADSAKAWRIRLREDLYWSNGQEINADTFLYSCMQMLDSRMENARANSLTEGDFALAGAKAYYEGTGAWEDVGILKTGEYELVLITQREVAQPEFYVPYYLQSCWLVYAPLWEQCKQYFAADGTALPGDCEEAVRVTSSYCTSPETAVACGPYTAVEYIPGEYLALERNFTWYGYADGEHLGQFQADHIYCLVIADYATALSAYRAGLLDMVSLQSQDAAEFADTGLLRYVPESYTTKLTFNTDPEALASRGTQVLANVYFRQAFAFAIDRSRLAGGSFGLVNNAYFADLTAFAPYRDSAAAGEILERLYGDGLSGTDMTLARQLMQQAFDACVADGSYDGTSEIVLRLSVYSLSDYEALSDFLRETLESVCQDTGFAGKVTLEPVEDPDCYATMLRGETDLIFTTWGGNVCDPYGLLMACYCGENAAEFGFDPAALTVEMEINGVRRSATLLQWAAWCAGETALLEGCEDLGAFESYDAESRAAMFAQLEFAYLSQFVTTPLYARGSIRLLSEKGDFAVKNQRNLVGFGGIRYYTFAYSDIEWAERIL